MAPQAPPYAPFVNFKGLNVIPAGTNMPTFSVNESGSGYFAGDVRIDGDLFMTNGTIVDGLFRLVDGLVVSGSIGAGYARTDAQIEISNREGGHTLLSLYNSYSATEECAISASAILDSGATVQQSSIFTLFVNGDNAAATYQTATAIHLIGGITGDTTPFIAYGNNGMKLLAGDTSGLPWNTAPPTNALEIGTVARNASLFLNATDFVFDASLFGGVGSFGVGTTSISTAYFYEDSPAITSGAGANFFRHLINSTGAVTIGTGTASIVASFGIGEPNITLSGNTVSVAATCYIFGAPTEGAANYALYVAGGAAHFVNTITAAAYIVGAQAGTSGTFANVTVVNGIVVSGS